MRSKLQTFEVPGWADYTFADNFQDYILGGWLNIDLTSIANARSVAIGFESSDVRDFGINTPTFVAMDSLRLIRSPSQIPSQC